MHNNTRLVGLGTQVLTDQARRISLGGCSRELDCGGRHRVELDLGSRLVSELIHSEAVVR